MDVLRLLKTDHKSLVASTWVPGNPSLGALALEHQPPIKESNYHETTMLCEVQASWRGPAERDSMERERERDAKANYLNEEVIFKVEPAAPATTVTSYGFETAYPAELFPSSWPTEP